jgi:hypothetical protein
MPFEPKNDLERSLVKAHADDAHREQFYADLLRSDVFAIQHGAHLPKTGESFAMKPGDPVTLGWLQHNGRSYIPFFTSLDALQLMTRDSVNFLQLNARHFLEMTRGNWLALNPYSDVGTEFSPDEITSILGGNLLAPS